MFRRALTILSVSFTALAGCAAETGESTSDASQDIATGMGAAAAADYRAFVAEATSHPLQSGCAPYAVAPASGVSYRGTAVLFHGFSACPQQYDELSRLLASQGYAVLVPLTPGHGRAYDMDGSAKATDHSEDVITDGNHQAYATFAKQMADIVAKTPGKHVAMGLSVGGAVAASAAEQSPGTFDRVLLMNAFFDIANGFGAKVTPVLNAVAPDFPYSWGQKCEDQRKLGRAGFCQFKVTNLRAAQHFGQETLARVGGIDAEVQVVGVENDPAASDSAIAMAAQDIPGSTACFFEKGVPHSLFSRQDNPGMNMYWLPAAKAEVSSFLVEGKTFPTVEASSVSGYSRCRAR